MPSHPAASMDPSPTVASPDDAGPLRSVHTPNFPGLLRHLGATLLVTTYQGGQLVMIRDEGERLNTHCRGFRSPMGLALTDGGTRLAIGTTAQVWDFRDVPEVARRLSPPGRHDACFMPRSSHITGAVRIHEMAYDAGGRLWFVNTRFSCLCTLHRDYSFVPRWRPSFVSALAAEDRCHLNGLAMVDGQPRFVTALGRSDTPRGRKPGKGWSCWAGGPTVPPST